MQLLPDRQFANRSPWSIRISRKEFEWPTRDLFVFSLLLWWWWLFPYTSLPNRRANARAIANMTEIKTFVSSHIYQFRLHRLTLRRPLTNSSVRAFCLEPEICIFPPIWCLYESVRYLKQKNTDVSGLYAKLHPNTSEQPIHGNRGERCQSMDVGRIVSCVCDYVGSLGNGEQYIYNINNSGFPFISWIHRLEWNADGCWFNYEFEFLT